jgi:predicted metal-dependent phosphoesterase TrpH
MYVDLHLHSSLSDGSLSPEQLAERLAVSGVRYAALTDHDTAAGVRRFQIALGKMGIGSVSGVELEAVAIEEPVHLLAYGFDDHHPGFNAVLANLRCPIWMGLRRSVESLGRTLRKSGRDEALPIQAAFQGVGMDGRLPVEDAIDVIHQAGGCVFLAHPLSGGLTFDRLEALVRRLQPQGLDGIEACYKPYSQGMLRDLLVIADKYRLMVSAGSDFHHPHAPNEQEPGIELPEPYWSRFLDAVSSAP